MSPPAGDIYCFCLRVCPSVRPSVRLSVTLSLSKNLSCKKNCKKNPKNNISTELVQQKIKIQFGKKIWKFWPKNHFLNLCVCLGQISVTKTDRDTDILCSVSENIPVVQCWNQICKMLIFGTFWAIFAILILKMALFLILSLMHLFLRFCCSTRFDQA